MGRFHWAINEQEKIYTEAYKLSGDRVGRINESENLVKFMNYCYRKELDIAIVSDEFFDQLDFTDESNTYTKFEIDLDGLARTKLEPKPKLLVVEEINDPSDAGVEYFINLTGRSGEELKKEYSATGGYHENGNFFFREWLLKEGYCRDSEENEIDIVYPND